MITDINAFTNNHLNAEISMQYGEEIESENGKKDLYWTYL